MYLNLLLELVAIARMQAAGWEAQLTILRIFEGLDFVQDLFVQRRGLPVVVVVGRALLGRGRHGCLFGLRSRIRRAFFCRCGSAVNDGWSGLVLHHDGPRVCHENLEASPEWHENKIALFVLTGELESEKGKGSVGLKR
jgi:hypothetical protein